MQKSFAGGVRSRFANFPLKLLVNAARAIWQHGQLNCKYWTANKRNRTTILSNFLWATPFQPNHALARERKFGMPYKMSEKIQSHKKKTNMLGFSNCPNSALIRNLIFGHFNFYFKKWGGVNARRRQRDLNNTVNVWSFYTNWQRQYDYTGEVGRICPLINLPPDDGRTRKCRGRIFFFTFFVRHPKVRRIFGVTPCSPGQH